MLYILVGLFGLLTAVVILIVGIIRHSSRGQRVDDNVQHFKNQAVVGQGVIGAFRNELQLGRDRRTQEAATGAMRATADATRAETEAKRAEHEKARVANEGVIANARDDLTLKEIQVRNELLGIAAAQGMDITAYLKVATHRELKQIDLEAREIEYKQDQEQISRVQQEKLELIDRATHRLYSMYRQRKELEASSDPARDDILNQLNYNISIAERLIRGEQARYLEAALGEKEVRGLPEADSPGRAESEEGEVSEPKRRGGWPKGKPRGNRTANK